MPFSRFMRRRNIRAIGHTMLLCVMIIFLYFGSRVNAFLVRYSGELSTQIICKTWHGLSLPLFLGQASASVLGCVLLANNVG